MTGDIALNTISGEFWRFIGSTYANAASWSFLGSLKGPAGPQGSGEGGGGSLEGISFDPGIYEGITVKFVNTETDIPVPSPDTANTMYIVISA